MFLSNFRPKGEKKIAKAAHWLCGYALRVGVSGANTALDANSTAFDTATGVSPGMNGIAKLYPNTSPRDTYANSQSSILSGLWEQTGSTATTTGDQAIAQSHGIRQCDFEGHASGGATCFHDGQ